MSYGLPYMGSKNLIARNIVEQMPPAENFVDLFCGGCAVIYLQCSAVNIKISLSMIYLEIAVFFC